VFSEGLAEKGQEKKDLIPSFVQRVAAINWRGKRS